jgi:hypothetical protein
MLSRGHDYKGEDIMTPEMKEKIRRYIRKSGFFQFF